MSTATATPTQIAPASGNAAVPAKKPTTIKGWLQSESLQAEIAKALPSHCSAERMARICLTAITRTPKLAECDPASFMKCLFDLSQWGLEPNGRDAHLIPFWNTKRSVTECQLILDYKGIVQLLYRSGKVKYIHADVVREGDQFEFSIGKVMGHVPHGLRNDPARPEKAGEIRGAYCIVELVGNAIKCEWMSKEEIDGIRSRSKAKDSGPWVTDYAEMAKKTVFRRASKWLPVSAEVVDAFDRDDTQFRSHSAPTRTAPSSLDQLANDMDSAPMPLPSPEPTVATVDGQSVPTNAEAPQPEPAQAPSAEAPAPEPAAGGSYEERARSVTNQSDFDALKEEMVSDEKMVPEEYDRVLSIARQSLQASWK